MSKGFSKKNLTTLLKLLKEDNIHQITLFQLVYEYMSKYEKCELNEYQLTEQIRREKKLFEDYEITVKFHRVKGREDKLKSIESTIDYILTTLNKNETTTAEFDSILKKKFGFPNDLALNYFSTYNIRRSARIKGLSFIGGNIDRGERTKKILTEFSKRKIVHDYKKMDRFFTAGEISKLLNGELKLRTIGKYTKFLTNELGVPMEIRAKIDYNKAEIKEIVDKAARLISTNGEIVLTPTAFISKCNTSVKVSLKRSDIIEFASYLKEHYNIRLEGRFESISETYNNYIKTINNYLQNNSKQFDISYRSSIPLYNETESTFIIHEKVKQDLISLWENYLNFYLKKLAEVRVNVKKSLIDNEENLKLDKENKKIYFLISDSFHIKNFTIEDIILLSFYDVKGHLHSYGVNSQHMVIGFLLYLYSKQLLLLPFKVMYNKYYQNKKAQSEFEMFLSKNIVFNKFLDYYERNQVSSYKHKQKRLLGFYLYTLRINIKLDDIQENHFKYTDQCLKYEQSNKLRKLLKGLGANLEYNKKKSKYTEEFQKYIDSGMYSNLINLFIEYIKLKVALKDTKSPLSFYSSSSSKFSEFLRFLDTYHKNAIINKDYIEELFDYPNSKLYTYQEYIDSREIEDSTKKSKLTILTEAFSISKEFKNVFPSSKIPNYSKNKDTPRMAIEDEELLSKIDDIVTNRPPKSSYYKNHKVKMDMSWWKHSDIVVPFEPLLIKLHLRVPVRGASLRLIDRNKLLIFDYENKVKGFKFVSDKNKTRKKDWSGNINSYTEF